MTQNKDFFYSLFSSFLLIFATSLPQHGVQMKKIFIAFLTAFLGFFGSFSLQLHTDLHSFEQSQSISINIINQYSPSKNEVINDLLALQRSLIVPLQIPIPEENAKNGFLLIQMTSEYVNNLLEQKDGLIVSAYQGQSLLGYILLIDISEFKELYEDEKIGFIETNIDLTVLEKLLSQPNLGYIEQIGVKPGYSRKGIGTQLIEASRKLKPNGLVADVFLEPLTNEASIHFFSKNGFKKVGILHQHPRKDFPHSHRTQVFFWNLICSSSEICSPN